MSASAVAAPSPGPAKDAGVARRLGRRRHAGNLIIAALCVAATLIALLFLATILVTLLWLGFGGLSWRVFTEITLPPGSHGGLLNAIIGSVIQTAIGTLIGTPVGLLVGTYLAEYSHGSPLGNAVRFVSDVLLSAPSILIGLFVYTLLVMPFGGFSGIAGCVALAVLVIPIVVRTTEDMLRLIPVSLREATVALGAPKWKMIVFVCYRAARDGIVTGILLAIARVAGETAPLLFTILTVTATNANVFSGANTALSAQIFANATQPYLGAQSRAWGAALTLIAIAFILLITARIITARFTRFSR